MPTSAPIAYAPADNLLPNSWYKAGEDIRAGDDQIVKKGRIFRTDQNGSIVRFHQEGRVFTYDTPIQDYPRMDDANISDLVRAQKWDEAAKKIQALPPSADAARLISLVLSLAFDAGRLAGLTQALASAQSRL